MALNIDDAEVDRLARELASVTGESLAVAVREAVRERLRRVQGRAVDPNLGERLREIRRRCASLPVLDDRSPDEILSYDDTGVPRSR